MRRNPKSDIVHKHNGLLGSVAFAKTAMMAVYASGSTSEVAKTQALFINAHLADLYEEIKNNPQY